MIQRLLIQNLVLIERAEIIFEKGLNILTGETGAGKSVILAALRLISGQKADLGLIRKDAETALVEAEISPFLSEGLFTLEEENLTVSFPCTVRREIHRGGKSRCFVNDSLVNLSSFKKLMNKALEFVDQNSSTELLSSEKQRQWVDSFAGHTLKVRDLNKVYSAKTEAQKTLDELEQTRKQKEMEFSNAEEGLAAFEELGLAPKEEEALAKEHELLAKRQELLEAASSASLSLTEGNAPVVSVLKRLTSTLEKSADLDSSLSESLELIRTAIFELEDASFSLRSFVDRLDADPNRLQEVEERIAAVNRLKRRFGPDLEDTQQKLIELVLRHESLSTEIESAEKALSLLDSQLNKLSLEVSEKRKKAAPELQKKVLDEVKTLNLPFANLVIQIEDKPISSDGKDQFSLYFSANPGQKPAPIEKCASGGELSRLLLALKTVIAGCENAACIVFDEIDSNVGGQTAVVLGEKLQKLAESRQLICVTHFVQVARFAERHFLVDKKEKKGLYYTTIQLLTEEHREAEFDRMMGNSYSDLIGEK